MTWLIVIGIIIAVFAFIFRVLGEVCATVLGNILEGVPNALAKLIGCFIITGIGSGILLGVYGWPITSTILKICIIATIGLIALAPIISIFRSGFENVLFKLIASCAIIAIGSVYLIAVYNWLFLLLLIKICIVAIIILIVLRIILAIVRL